MSELREEIVSLLRECGADIVRFQPAERFEGTPVKALLPGARTVIGAVFRILRGALRGIEEGTTFYQYGTNALEVLEETVMPMALLRACALIERRGFEALPQRRQMTIVADEHATSPEVFHEEVYRGVKPETALDFPDMALRCGLGEIGRSGALLTREFGPLQRYCFLLTDAELAASPLPEAGLCDGCGECERACPGSAIRNGKIDSWQCAAYYKGARMEKNPFMPPDALADMPDREEILSGRAHLDEETARRVLERLIDYPGFKHAYAPCLCGRACDAACYAHLEEAGKLSKAFRSPFRKRPAWKLDVPEGCKGR